MMLFPTEHARILVDNDYIMASLGVLSKRYREAAIRLLEKSLDFQFPEKKEQEIAVNAKFMADVDRELAEAKAKEEEYRKHIEECEAMGYDMTAFKEEEAIGGASEKNWKPQERRRWRKQMKRLQCVKGGGIKGKWAAQTENGGQYMGDCTHDCKHCTRRNCPNRVE